MSIGLIGLLDDIAAIAKVAAASLDDVASQAAKAGVKAAGVVIDDTAVTPGYVIGFEPKRELPIVGKIAAGSLRNKLLILLPAALVLSYFLPWTITPLLMLGGAYLCYEGVEKVLEAVMPHHAHQHEAQLGTVALERAVGRRREGRKRDQDRLHSLGRDHGDHAGGPPRREHLEAGACAGGRGNRNHRRRVWRGGADREGRRCRYGAGTERRRLGASAARSDVASFAACPCF